jgi:hypothetical protein
MELIEGLCTGCGIREGRLFLEIRSEEKKLWALEPGAELALATPEARRCIGYRPPGAPSLIPCPNEARGTSSAQCPECFGGQKILPCLRCSGERCHNPDRRGECVQPANHALYLASFGPGVLKVGVARWERRHERLAEQGALAGLILARDDGQQIRRLETQIKRAGVRDRIPPTEKLRLLAQGFSRAEIETELAEAALGLRHRMRGAWLQDPEPVETAERPMLARGPRLIVPRPGLALRGRLEALVGQMLIVAADSEELLALEAGALVGYELRALERAERTSGQIALAFG